MHLGSLFSTRVQADPFQDQTSFRSDVPSYPPTSTTRLVPGLYAMAAPDLPLGLVRPPATVQADPFQVQVSLMNTQPEIGQTSPHKRTALLLLASKAIASCCRDGGLGAGEAGVTS